jgi:hypothetical protein
MLSPGPSKAAAICAGVTFGLKVIPALTVLLKLMSKQAKNDHNKVSVRIVFIFIAQFF